jgi:hypothetical protein
MAALWSGDRARAQLRGFRQTRPPKARLTHRASKAVDRSSHELNSNSRFGPPCCASNALSSPMAPAGFASVNPPVKRGSRLVTLPVCVCCASRVGTAIVDAGPELPDRHSEAGSAAMPRYIVERSFLGLCRSSHFDDGAQVFLSVIGHNVDLGVTRVAYYVIDEQHKMLCVRHSPDPERMCHCRVQQTAGRSDHLRACSIRPSSADRQSRVELGLAEDSHPCPLCVLGSSAKH